MKVTIRQRPVATGEEEEVVIWCDEINARTKETAEKLKLLGYTLTGIASGYTAILEPGDIYYIETVDGRVLAIIFYVIMGVYFILFRIFLKHFYQYETKKLNGLLNDWKKW